MLLGLGIAGLDIDGSVVTNIGGTIQANGGSFVHLDDGTKIIGGRLKTNPQSVRLGRRKSQRP